MHPIERFERRLRLTQGMVGKRLPRARGGQIGNLLGRIEEVQRALGWMPKPTKPGNGPLGEGTKKMSGGRLP